MPIFCVRHVNDSTGEERVYGPFSSRAQADRWRDDRIERESYFIFRMMSPSYNEQEHRIVPSYAVADVLELKELIEQFESDGLEEEAEVNIRIKGHYVPLRRIHHNGNALTFDAENVNI